jgi:4-phytase / acid phosphatase
LIFRIAAAVLALAGALAAQAPKLKYTVVVTRHGVRSPTWTPDRLNRYSTSPWPDFGVPPGNLTTHGRVLIGQMGQFYRGFLGSPTCSGTYFHADTDQRTLETARALAEAMLPGCKTEIHSAGEGKSDPLFDPIEAGVVKPDARLALAAVQGRIGPKLDALVDAHRAAFDVLNFVLNGKSKAAMSIFDEPMALSSSKSGVSMSGPLSLASTFTENFLLEYTNGMSGDQLGWGRLNAANLREMMALHTAYADLMRRTPYLARTRGGNLMEYILHAMETATPDKSLLVISGHDTNISNLSGMLGLSWVLPGYQPDDAPPGGALIFTLWQTPAGKSVVRVQFVAQTMEQMHDATPLSAANPPAAANIFVPGCSTSAEGYPCDWDAFVETARRTR